MKIAFRYVPFYPEQKKKLTDIIESAGHEAIWLPDDMPSAEDVQDCEVLMGYFPVNIFKDLPKLKWLQVPSAGVDRFCGDLYANSDVILSNCSGAFGVAISEFIFTGLLMLMRLMPQYMKNQSEQVWRCEGTCRSIYGSTITVVGMGDLGKNFAKRAKAFGAHVRGVRRNRVVKPEFFDEVYTSDEIHEAVRGADAVVLCLPGTKETKGIISKDIISHMDKNTILVNCGRGMTVDQEALTQALAEQKLAGAVLDVFEVEPLPKDHPLWNMKNVILTPHISGHDDDPVNIEFMYSIFETNLKRYLAGEPLENVVDRKLGY